MTITLPSASLRMINTGAQRVSTGRATEARDVRPVPPDRDPGVRMPNIPTGGFEALAKGLSIFADIKARQQKAFDSNAVTAIERQAQRKFNEEAQRRKREGAVALDEVVADDDPDPVIDATHPDFYADAVNFSESLIASEVARLPRGVSDSAKMDLRNRLFSQATTFAKAMGDYSLDQTEKQTSDNIDAIGRTSSDEVLFNPQNVDIERGKAQKRLDAFEGLGDPNMLRDKRREVDQDIIKGAINGHVNDQEFDKAHALLERLGKELNPGDQNALGRLIDRKEESARKERIRLDEKAERDAEKAEKERQEFNTARLADDILEGRGDGRVLDDALENGEVSGSQFITLRKMLDAEEAPEDDPWVVNSLDQSIDAGSVVTMNEINDAWADGTITLATRNRLRARIDGESVLNTAAAKRARKSVRENAEGETGPLGALDPQDRLRVNDAYREFDERVLKGEDPWEVADDIAPRYRVEPRTLESFATPRFRVGPREKPDIKATREATVRAFKRGDITRDEFNRQARLLEQLEPILEEQRKADEKKKTGTRR